MASSSDISSPLPWPGVAETISDTASEPNSVPESPSVSDYRDTLSGRWGRNPLILKTRYSLFLLYNTNWNRRIVQYPNY